MLVAIIIIHHKKITSNHLAMIFYLVTFIESLLNRCAEHLS